VIVPTQKVPAWKVHGVHSFCVLGLQPAVNVLVLNRFHSTATGQM